jgi:hypothetical protein
MPIQMPLPVGMAIPAGTAMYGMNLAGQNISSISILRHSCCIAYDGSEIPILSAHVQIGMSPQQQIQIQQQMHMQQYQMQMQPNPNYPYPNMDNMNVQPPSASPNPNQQSNQDSVSTGLPCLRINITFRYVILLLVFFKVVSLKMSCTHQVQ